MSVLTQLTAVQCGGAQAAQHWQHCCRSRAFTIGHFTLEDSLSGFAGLGLFRMLLCKPTSLQMEQWWVCSALLLFEFPTGMLPPEFLNPATANKFCWYSSLTNHFRKFGSQKVPYWTEGKAGSVLKNAWILSGNWWEPEMCSVCVLATCGEGASCNQVENSAFHCFSLNRFDPGFYHGIKSLYIVI